MAMNGDQVRLLMATIEVMGNALRLVLAERMADLPAQRQDALLSVLEAGLSQPREDGDMMTSPVFLSRSELSDWMPVAAGQFVDGVREQLRDLSRSEKAPETSADVVPLRRSA